MFSLRSQQRRDGKKFAQRAIIELPLLPVALCLPHTCAVIEQLANSLVKLSHGGGEFTTRFSEMQVYGGFNC